MSDFNKSESWVKRGEGFTVEVKHWELSQGHNWSVYAHIFEKHPIFNNLDAQRELPLHCGHSKWEKKTFEDVVVREWSKKTQTISIGSDYQHIYDDRFQAYSTKEEAWEVFRDAEKLFRELTEVEDA
jgi:hypothetical protein